MTRVVFACVHNAGRSQMAAAFFNSFAAPEQAQALSAGTAPAARVHPQVVEAMREIGLDLCGARPQQLTADVTRDAALLVTMGCGDSCPLVPGMRRIDWPLADPRNQSLEAVRAIRDEIRDRVRHLVSSEGWGAPGP